METTQHPFDWSTTLTTTYSEVSRYIVETSPKLLAALALLLAGWVVARLAALAARRLTGWIDLLLLRFLRRRGRAQTHALRPEHGMMIGRVVFWIVMLFFIAASTQTLGWQMFADWVNGLIRYLPKLVTGLLIILAGTVLSNLVRAATATALLTTGLPNVDLLSRIAQGATLLLALVIGIEQLGINIQFLTQLLVVVVGILLSGLTLAFSFGARHLVANVIAAQQVRRHCQIGERLSIGTIEGILIDITATSLIIETATGRALVPTRLFHEVPMHLTTHVPTTPPSSRHAEPPQ